MTVKTDLAKRIEKSLINNEQTQQAAIEVLDDNGVITLMGTVEEPETRDLAGELVRNQSGVISVINDLNVESTSENSVDGILPIAPASHTSQ